MNETKHAPDSDFRVIAIIAAYNEGDVISHVIRDLIENGVRVYLIDNCSTDGTMTEAAKWLGRGLLHIERFPEDAGFPERASREYVWRDLLRRKEQLSSLLDADWFIHADADEFRESVWPNMRLADGIQLVNQLGYNAIDFAVLNFRPTDDRFVPGEDVRRFLTCYEPPSPYDVLQIKAWKNSNQAPDLVSSGGHEARFGGRKVFPFQFPLRHYPIRGPRHGRQKVFVERLPRFIAEERETGWHVQYDQFRRDADEFIWAASDLIPYDPARVRSEIVARAHQRLQRILPTASSCDSGSEIETAAAQSIEAICNQLHDKANFIQLYNLASLLVASDRRELARQMFTVLSQLVVTVNPDLAGKSSYKLALLSEDIHREAEHLRTCLKLCPSHRAARARLVELDSHAE